MLPGSIMSNGFSALSLQQKVSLTLLAVMTVLALLSYAILTSVIAPAFDRLELDTARTNLVRAANSIQTDLENLDAIVRDWAPWDDAYAYARGEYPEFQRSNLNRPTLTNLNLDLLLLYDAGGGLLWGQLLHEGADTDPGLLGVLGAGDPRSGRLIRHTELTGLTKGLLRTALGPMLFISRPILTSYDEGPIAGTMVMAQFLDERRFTNLRERTEVAISSREIAPGSAAVKGLPTALNAVGVGSMQHESTVRSIVSRGRLNDLYGEPLMILEVATPRRISALGGNTINGALIFLAIAGIVVAVVTWLLLRSIIVLPLEGLADHITAIRDSGDLTERLNETRTDEIGALAHEFDQMMTEVHDARQESLEKSFKAGKADTAAEVLHNIRNAMTPLINGVDRLDKYSKVVNGLKVSQATAELRDDQADEDRRSKLIDYVDSAFEHVKESCAHADNEVNVISKQARQVEAILADQEKHTNVAPVAENLGLDEVLAEAVLVIPKADSPAVEVSREDAITRLRVRAHRVGLLQVLGNLILNAYESIQRSDTGSGRIRLSARNETVGDKSMVRVTISDSGCGFDMHDSTKLFQRGFSSKSGNTSGLGLHWCANALAGMGGRIQAESMGPGRGAEFHVLLPAA